MKEVTGFFFSCCLYILLLSTLSTSTSPNPSIVSKLPIFQRSRSLFAATHFPLLSILLNRFSAFHSARHSRRCFERWFPSSMSKCKVSEETPCYTLCTCSSYYTSSWQITRDKLFMVCAIDNPRCFFHDAVRSKYIRVKKHAQELLLIKQMQLISVFLAFSTFVLGNNERSTTK